VASDSTDNGQSGSSGGQESASHEPRECMACRGTGQVISNLGASPSALRCPWCEGSGVRVPGVDAQAHWAGNDTGEDATSQAPEPAA